jgi:sortase (surface protein transpeptidase)
MIRRTSIIAIIVTGLTLILVACGSSSSAGRSSTGASASDNARVAATQTATTSATAPSTAADVETEVTQPSTTPTSIPVTPTPLVLPTPRPLVQTSPPVHLRVPSIGIDTNVQRVRSDEQGKMGVPSNYTDVAWFEPGVSPGTPGNAVIDGHLDSQSGPAVFYKLEDLNPGDEVFVTTEDGQELRFVVTATESYPTNEAPLERIFGPAVNARLNLITCEGVFDRSLRQYDQRLVVYTVLMTR